MRDGPRASRRIVLLAVLFEGGLGVGGAFLGWAVGLPLGDSLRWDAWDALLGVAVSVPMLVVFWLCYRWPVGPLARIKQFSVEVIRPLFAPCTLLELALVSLLAGVGEEILFRGVLQPLCGRWAGPWGGLVLASLLF